MLTAEQFFAAHKANVETLFGLTTTAFQGVEKLVELNMQVAKTALAEAVESTQGLLSVKDAQELLALQSTLLQPSAEKAASYSRHVQEITSGTSAEIAKVAEAQVADAQAKFAALVETAAKNAPAGSENVVALVKNAITTANNALESVQKAGKQAADVAAANFQAATNSAVKATQAGARSSKRAA
ncbi:phasin family protein [Paucibacter sp. B2R-40]|jgi:phasin family protein|uniref:phasin family protein n=1 Tax=Paucibacter sp. B2R-40 TaxID=2893554 RepID=UPI0021E443C2|nr:phasin family protein [Paucibacter sp. B2R-40]MCV2355225.1 phasin family protein [Paucibacter sp. B2R-40]